MICTVLHHKNFGQLQEILPNCEMAEIRLDTCPLSPSEINELFSSDVPLVATCRVSEVLNSMNDDLPQQSRLIKAAQKAENVLVRAIEAGARFVDVEIEAPKQMSKRVRQAARENGTVFIRSCHDFNSTPSSAELKGMVEKCRYHGADMVKIAMTSNSPEDCARVLSLYKDYEPYALIAFCMGELGRQSRLDCLALGAPFTYAAPSEDGISAPGQWTYPEMRRAVYGDFGFIDAPAVDVPSSKSFAQRTIIAAALSDGVSRLHAYTPCEDSEAAISVAGLLGADVQREGDTLVINGHPGVLEGDTVDVGESGLLARLMIPLSAALSKAGTRIVGKRTLERRSLDGVPEIMSSFGVKVSSGDDSGVFVPLKVEGHLQSGSKTISGVHGSQLISGLLMALPLLEKNSSISVKNPKSIPYMFITVEVLKKFGIKVSSDMLGGQEFLESGGDWSLCSEIVFKTKGSQCYRSSDIRLEGDWSAAANFLVAGAVFGRVCIQGLDTSSLQADLSIMDILMDAGASLSQTDGDRGPVTVQRAPLSAFSVDASNCPDLFPIVSVLAAFCQGESHIGGLSRLVHKESDRGQAIVLMLRTMGVECRVDSDELVIVGKSLSHRLLRGELLRGGNYSSFGDHRMAMALKVASLGADSPIVIDDVDCIKKSFPEFNTVFQTL